MRRAVALAAVGLVMIEHSTPVAAQPTPDPGGRVTTDVEVPTRS